jgi:hypothetical protein
VSPEEVKRVRAFGRTRVELLVESAKMLPSSMNDTDFFRGRPRSLLSIVQAELSRLEEARDRERFRRRGVGRKSAK